MGVPLQVKETNTPMEAKLGGMAIDHVLKQLAAAQGLDEPTFPWRGHIYTPREMIDEVKAGSELGERCAVALLKQSLHRPGGRPHKKTRERTNGCVVFVLVGAVMLLVMLVIGLWLVR